MKTFKYVVLIPIIVLLAVQIGAQNGDPPTSDGAMEGVNLQRSGVYKTKGVHQLHNVIWKSEVLCRPSEDNTYSHSIIVGEKLFLMCSAANSRSNGIGGYDEFSDNNIYALDITTGKPIWRFGVKQSNLSVLAVAAGTVYFGSNKGYFGSDGGVFFALDAATGKEKWSYPVKKNRLATAYPAVVNDAVYFEDMVGNFYSLNAASGQLNWIFNRPGDLTIASFLDGVVYVGAKNSIFALNSKNGELKWEYKAASAVGDPVVSNTIVYFGTKDGTMYGLDAATGTQMARFKPVHRIGTFFSINSGIMYYAGASGNVYAIDALTGKEQWQFKTEKPCVYPIVADGAIYVSCQDGIYAVNVKTGQQEWKAESKTAFSHTPAVANGVVYFARDDGRIYSLH